MFKYSLYEYNITMIVSGDETHCMSLWNPEEDEICLKCYQEHGGYDTE